MIKDRFNLKSGSVGRQCPNSLARYLPIKLVVCRSRFKRLHIIRFIVLQAVQHQIVPTVGSIIKYTNYSGIVVHWKHLLKQSNLSWWTSASNCTQGNCTPGDHRETQYKPGKIVWNKIDYILVSKRYRNGCTAVKTYPGADIRSDHASVVRKFKIKMKWVATKKVKRMT